MLMSDMVFVLIQTRLIIFVRNKHVLH